MKKYLILVLIVFIIGTLVIGVQAAGGKVTKSTGKDAAAMIPAGDMFPPGNRYDNECQIPGAKGKVNMIQPNGNVDVILGVSVDGLTPNAEYKVYFDQTGIDPMDDGTAGDWTLMGSFWTDECGHGDWNYTAPAGDLEAGTYTWSVFINQIVCTYKTILISYNVEFKIE